MTVKIRRPLARMEAAANGLLELLRPACRRIEVAGSVRRRRPEAADVELVAIPEMEVSGASQLDLFGGGDAEEKARNLLWRALDGMGGQVEHLKRGEKYRAFLWPVDGAGRVQVDLFTAVPENWGLILLIRTGSAEFSRHVVTELKHRGTPSAGGFLRGRDGKPIATPIEESVFELAGMAFVPPERRSWG